MPGYSSNEPPSSKSRTRIDSGTRTLSRRSEAVRQGSTGRARTFDRLGKFLAAQYDPADFALRLLHKDVSLAVGLGKEVGVPMRLANMALEELTEAMTRGWGTRDSRVGMLLQVERSGIEQPHEDINKINAIIADKSK